MNSIAIRHYNVTAAYCTSPFNTKRHEVAKQIRQFLNLRRFRKHIRSFAPLRLA
ncbi:MAG: hypothetical protein AAB473_03245 [Patescibacteria group bacterium]